MTTILVVDDDESMRALIRLHLSAAGYRVVEAADAIVAGKCLLEHAPDLIIADVKMPYMDGIEFITALRADESIPYIPVIFVTAYEESADQAQALGSTVLVKPIVADELLKAVADTLAKHAALH